MCDDPWHRPLTRVRGGELRGDTGQTPGMTRWEAIPGKNTGGTEAADLIARPPQEPIVVTLESLRPHPPAT